MSRLAAIAVILAVMATACDSAATQSHDATASEGRIVPDSAPQDAEAAPDRANGADAPDDPERPGRAEGSHGPGQDHVAQASHLDVGGRSLSGGIVELATFVGSPVVLWMWTPW
ncbi:MAG: hypothetical protein WD152_05650 [Nitriliruptoraceae bacterium]